MDNSIYVDTSGFFSLLIKNDDMHAKAVSILKESAQKGLHFTTTDYVLDETATLLMARNHAHLAKELFSTIFSSKACQVEWMDQDRFKRTHLFFSKYLDHKYSFTDCFSFIIMKDAKQHQALTKDKHFQELGFDALLVNG